MKPPRKPIIGISLGEAVTAVLTRAAIRQGSHLVKIMDAANAEMKADRERNLALIARNQKILRGEKV